MPSCDLSCKNACITILTHEFVFQKCVYDALDFLKQNLETKGSVITNLLLNLYFIIKSEFKIHGVHRVCSLYLDSRKYCQQGFP